MVKNPPANAKGARDLGLIPGQEDPLEKEMATHSSILAWKIPWIEEPGGLQSMGSQSDTTEHAHGSFANKPFVLLQLHEVYKTLLSSL